MRLIKILQSLLLVVFFAGCSPSHMKAVKLNPEQTIDSLLIAFNESILNGDAKNEIIWKKLMVYDTVLVDYFINRKNDLRIDLKFSFKNKVYKSYNDAQPMLSGSEASLYFINAIYYDNYFFASHRVLYRNETLDSSFSGGKWSYYKPIISAETFESDSIHLNTAWVKILDWRKRNRGKSLEQIRKGNDKPFSGCDLYYYNEPGGKIQGRI